MSILQSYPLGNPTAKDYVIGTKIPPADTDEKPTTNNFSVASIASFANSYSLGYTVYTAALIQTGASAPVATVLQNTTGGTFTWSGGVSTGKSSITVSGITLPANKVAIFVSSGVGDFSLGGRIISTTQIDITQLQVGALVDGMLPGTSIEVRIYS